MKKIITLVIAALAIMTFASSTARASWWSDMNEKAKEAFEKAQDALDQSKDVEVTESDANSISRESLIEQMEEKLGSRRELLEKVFDYSKNPFTDDISVSGDEVTFEIAYNLSYVPNLLKLGLLKILDDDSYLVIKDEDVTFKSRKYVVPGGLEISKTKKTDTITSLAITSVTEEELALLLGGDKIGFRLSIQIEAGDKTYVHLSKAVYICAVDEKIVECPELGEPPVDDNVVVYEDEDVIEDGEIVETDGDKDTEPNVVGIFAGNEIDTDSPGSDTTLAAQGMDWSGGGCSLNPYAASGAFGILWACALVMLTPLAAIRIRRKK